jgi:hypothetical protein
MPRKYRQTTSAERAQMVELNSKGWNDAEIGRMLGIRHDTVSSNLRGLGIASPYNENGGDPFLAAPAQLGWTSVRRHTWQDTSGQFWLVNRQMIPLLGPAESLEQLDAEARRLGLSL